MSRNVPSLAVLGALIASGTILRFLWPVRANPLAASFMGAPLVQWQNALAPLDYNPLFFIDPFFFPLWLSIIARLTLGDPWALGIYAGLLSAITPWIWYRFLRELFPSKETALVGWSILAWLPSWTGIFNYLMPETLLLPLVGLSLWMTWRSVRKSGDAAFYAAVLSWLAAILTKMTVLPVAAVGIGWILYRQPSKVRRVMTIAGIVIAVMLVLGFRSKKVLGVWAPFGFPFHNRIYMASGAETLNLQIEHQGRLIRDYKFTSIATYSEPFDPLSRWRSSRRGVCTVRVVLENGLRDWKTAYRVTKQSFGRRLQLTFENVIFLVWGPSWPDRDARRAIERVSYHSRWMWAPLLLLVMAGNFWFFRRKRRLPLLPCLTCVGWMFMLAQPVAPAEGRYRKPFEGLLIANAIWLITVRKAKSE